MYVCSLINSLDFHNIKNTLCPFKKDLIFFNALLIMTKRSTFGLCSRVWGGPIFSPANQGT